MAGCPRSLCRHYCGCCAFMDVLCSRQCRSSGGSAAACADGRQWKKRKLPASCSKGDSVLEASDVCRDLCHCKHGNRVVPANLLNDGTRDGRNGCNDHFKSQLAFRHRGLAAWRRAVCADVAQKTHSDWRDCSLYFGWLRHHICFVLGTDRGAGTGSGRTIFYSDCRAEHDYD